MSLVYPLSQNPTLFLDGTTLVEPPNTVELTSDIVKPIFDPLGVQISQAFPNFRPEQNETILFPTPRANMALIVQVKADNSEGLGAFQIAFGHPFIGNEDILYVLCPTEKTNYTFIVFSPSLRDRVRVFNSSFSSYSINVTVVDAVRVPAPAIPVSGGSSSMDVLVKNWEKMIEAFNASFLLPLTDPVSGQPQVVPIGITRPCGLTPPGPIG